MGRGGSWMHFGVPTSWAAPTAGFVVTASQGSPISGVVTLTASGMATTNLSSIQFLLDGYVLEAAVTAAPWQITWQTALAQDGSHSFSAVATYVDASQALSAPLMLTITNPTTFHSTYYVDAAAGSDAANGTSTSTPWLTLAKANSTIAAGDTVYLKGAFGNQTIQGPTGTQALPIRWTRWPGFTASITNNGVTWNALSYLILDGIDASGGGLDTPISIGNGAHHCAIRNGTYTSDRRVRGQVANDCVVENCSFSDVGSEASNGGDTIRFENGANRNKVLFCTFSNGGHSCVMLGERDSSAGHFGSDTATNLQNVVAHNTIINHWGMPLAINDLAQKTLVEYNDIQYGAFDSATVGPRYGITLQSNNNTIRYNRVFHNTGGGIQLSAYLYNGVVPQNCVGNCVYGNTFYNNGMGNANERAGSDQSNTHGPGLGFNVQNGRTNQDNLVVNNVFYLNYGRFIDTYPSNLFTIFTNMYSNTVDWAAGTLNGNKVKNNLFLRAAASAGEVMSVLVRVGGTNNFTGTLANFQSTFSADVAGNLESNPNFLSEVEGNANFLKVPTNSAAVNAGIPVVDTNGYHATQRASLGSAPDIGWHEAA